MDSPAEWAGGQADKEISLREKGDFLALLKTAVPEFHISALLSQNSRDIFFLLMTTEVALRS